MQRQPGYKQRHLKNPLSFKARIFPRRWYKWKKQEDAEYGESCYDACEDRRGKRRKKTIFGPLTFDDSIYKCFFSLGLSAFFSQRRGAEKFTNEK